MSDKPKIGFRFEAKECAIYWRGKLFRILHRILTKNYAIPNNSYFFIIDIAGGLIQRLKSKNYEWSKYFVTTRFLRIILTSFSSAKYENNIIFSRSSRINIKMMVHVYNKVQCKINVV